ncbi:MAG: 2-C-methyl-D-erythritol 2,4-cyclodiphosphate synthase [Clostridia bacterium]|nr:2-C-methyl-D-erythritol 2,4-cyclodiphosphate synthase [Clostridia bacterium]
MRIGQGYDVHKLVEDRDLILCGVNIPYEKGLLGHSDADVALHALSDAILGAAAMGDIGKHFPDTEETYKGADSMLLLRKVVNLVRDKGYSISNADVTIVAQRPKISGYIDRMRENVAATLDVSIDRVSVKATTTEKLGFEGRGEGISAMAVVLLNE